LATVRNVDAGDSDEDGAASNTLEDEVDLFVKSHEAACNCS